MKDTQNSILLILLYSLLGLVNISLMIKNNNNL